MYIYIYINFCQKKYNEGVGVKENFKYFFKFQKKFESKMSLHLLSLSNIYRIKNLDKFLAFFFLLSKRCIYFYIY